LLYCLYTIDIDINLYQTGDESMDISIQRVDRVLKRIKSITIEVEAKLDQEMAEAKKKCKCIGLHGWDCPISDLILARFNQTTSK